MKFPPIDCCNEGQNHLNFIAPHAQHAPWLALRGIVAQRTCQDLFPSVVSTRTHCKHCETRGGLSNAQPIISSRLLCRFHEIDPDEISRSTIAPGASLNYLRNSHPRQGFISPLSRQFETDPKTPRMSDKKNEDFTVRIPDDSPRESYGGENRTFKSSRPATQGPRALPGSLAVLENSPGLAILAYCFSSISMTVVNKYVVSGDEWNLYFFYLAIQVLLLASSSEVVCLLRILSILTKREVDCLHRSHIGL